MLRGPVGQTHPTSALCARLCFPNGRENSDGQKEIEEAGRAPRWQQGRAEEIARAKNRGQDCPQEHRQIHRAQEAQIQGPRRRLPPSGRAPKQRIAISHHREEDFKADGLRAYAQYRDLGFAGATHGLAQAHVIRLIGPCDPAEVSKLHFHDVDFQMVYVLKGWVKTYMEGHGETPDAAGQRLDPAAPRSSI